MNVVNPIINLPSEMVCTTHLSMYDDFIGFTNMAKSSEFHRFHP